MTVQIDPRVMELVASRICHDLVSPVGAVSNGVELMEEFGEDAGGEAMQLISNSARQASVKLKCFRLCYGAAGTDKNIGWHDVHEVFSDWINSTPRVKLEWDSAVSQKLPQPPKGFMKVLLNVLILAEECNHGEGSIHVEPSDDGAGVTVLVTGNHAGFREGAEPALAGETAIEDLDPRSVHAYVCGLFARYFGLAVEHKAEPDFGKLAFTVACPS